MKQLSLTALPLALMIGCAPVPAPPPATTLPVMGGYRDPADQCQQLGESADTVEYLDHTADLVGCPEDYEGLGVFVTETGGVEVARVQGWVLFSVSRE